MSERLPANWLPGPMRIGAFDRADRDPEDDTDMDEDGFEQEDITDDEMA